MPWERQFDVDETLEKAMMAFWRQGYGATSMQNLVEAMGINPGSIYATYGNKRDLFIQSLRLYESVFLARFDGYAETNSPRDAIMEVFECVVTDALEDPDYCGCLLVNTALELAPRDKEIGGLVSKELRSTGNFFRRMIKSGQISGNITPGVDPKKASDVLLGLLTGLRVLSRGRPERAVLRAVADQAKRVVH